MPGRKFILVIAVTVGVALASTAFAQPMPDDSVGIDSRTIGQTQTAQSRPAGAAHGQADSNHSLGPLEMVLDDQLIASFKHQGQLSALIEPRQYVNEIMFIYAPNENDNHDHEVTGIMTPVSKRGNVLAFELTDFDLQTIRQKGLRYKFDQFERGRYETVRVDYRSTNGSFNAGTTDSNSAESNSSGNQFSGGSASGNRLADNGFGSPPSRRQPGNFLPPPSPDFSQPGDRDFMGPAMKPLSRPPLRDTATQRGTQPGSLTWEPTPRPGNQTNSFPQNNQFSSSSLDPAKNTSFDTRWNTSNSLNRSEMTPTASELAAQRRQQELDRRRDELLRQKQQLEEAELAELERANYLKQAGLRELEEQRRQTELARRDAYQSFPTKSQIPTNRLAGNTNRNYSDRLAKNSLLENSPPGTGTTSTGTSPQNVPTFNASISGPNPGVLANGNQERTEGILYFMLWFSLGLNIYLGWLSRGFYVRYNELADELRETFTATV